MRKLLAFVRRDALVAVSYRFSSLVSLASLVTLVVPLYFVAKAIQPIVGASITSEGGQYFAFLVAGMATYQLVMTAVTAIPSAIAGGIRTGTFEALLTTPSRLATLVAGMIGYPFLWGVARAVVLIVVGRLLGAHFEMERLGLAVLIWGAVTLAYLPFGILSSALLLVTRTTGPLPTIVLTASMLLGGVYYPTTVIPSWLRTLSEAVPLTYGLRALRRVLAPEVPLAQVAADLGILMSYAGGLLLVSAILFQMALAHARRTGTLAQY